MIRQRRKGAGAVVWQPGVDMAKADAAEGATEGATDVATDAVDPEHPRFRHVALPFGPFLAIGAVFYLFAEPWIWLHFRFSGG